MSDPTQLQTLKAPTLTIGGKWHEPEKPLKNAAFRLTYVMISERYDASAAYSTLCTVFRDTGLLTDAECQHVINVSCGFAGMPVHGFG